MSDTTTCEWCGREFEDSPPCKPYCSRKCEAEDPNSSFQLKWYEEQREKHREEKEEAKRKREEAGPEPRRGNLSCLGGCLTIPICFIPLAFIRAWIEGEMKGPLWLAILTVVLAFSILRWIFWVDKKRHQAWEEWKSLQE